MNKYSRHPVAAATNIEDHADVVTNGTFDESFIDKAASLVRLGSGNE